MLLNRLIRGEAESVVLVFRVTPASGTVTEAMANCFGELRLDAILYYIILKYCIIYYIIIYYIIPSLAIERAAQRVDFFLAQSIREGRSIQAAVLLKRNYENPANVSQHADFAIGPRGLVRGRSFVRSSTTRTKP